MSDKLNTLVDNYVNNTNINSSSKDDELIIEAAKKRLKQEIYIEIYKEVKDKALRDADTRIAEQKELHHIKELKKLAIEGLIVAFFVGLLVNQVTDIISFLKGTLVLESIFPTLFISLALLFICVLIFLLEFILTFIELWRKVKK